jgi:hypothetical protein
MKPIVIHASLAIAWVLEIASLATFIYFARATKIPLILQPWPLIMQFMVIGLIARVFTEIRFLPRAKGARIAAGTALSVAVLATCVIAPATIYGMLVPT